MLCPIHNLMDCLKIFAWQDLPDYWSDKGFKGIIVNQALPLRVTWNYINRPVNDPNPIIWIILISSRKYTKDETWMTTQKKSFFQELQNIKKAQ